MTISSLIFFYLPCLCVGLSIVLILLPLVLAGITLVLRRFRRRSRSFSNTKCSSSNSCMYAGRVWHTRHQPTRHSFTYPLFIFSMDLEESVSSLRTELWPFSLLVSFREEDHLKNGEGMAKSISGTDKNANDLYSRIGRLVRERTHNHCSPSTSTHQISLVTHLSYYGYCFNPVSFYYIRRKEKQSLKLEAVVAEVSNTPWNEMYCYVLHPRSGDVLSTSEEHTLSGTTTKNYVFDKRFHVSPFMEMEYKYDWIFEETSSEEETRLHGLPEKLRVVTALKTNDSRTQFIATMNVHYKADFDSDLLGIAWKISTFPIYCMIVQIWIHYEAFWLFWKGVEYQPHPDASETWASRIIGTIMVPFFALQELVSHHRQGSKPTSE